MLVKDAVDPRLARDGERRKAERDLEDANEGAEGTQRLAPRDCHALGAEGEVMREVCNNSAATRGMKMV